MADLAKCRMRAKIPKLTEALAGRFSDHHRFLVRLFLDRIDAHSADIDRLTERIEEALCPSVWCGNSEPASRGSALGSQMFSLPKPGPICQFSPRRPSWHPGPAPRRDRTNPPAGSSPPRPALATPISKGHSASPPCPRRRRRTRISVPNTGGSLLGAAR